MGLATFLWWEKMICHWLRIAVPGQLMTLVSDDLPSLHVTRKFSEWKKACVCWDGTLKNQPNKIGMTNDNEI